MKTIEVQFDIGDEVYIGYLNSFSLVVMKDKVEEIIITKDKKIVYKLALNRDVGSHKVFSTVEEVEEFWVTRLRTNVREYKELVLKNKLIEVEKQKEG